MTNERTKETIILRGLCSAIQQMHSPTFNNLKDLMSQVGYKIQIDQEKLNNV